MTDIDLIPGPNDRALRNVARDMHQEFGGVFGADAIQASLPETDSGPNRVLSYKVFALPLPELHGGF
jgi:hypothetical protein